jgi:leader peptidase (prepilin peptidase) / N-methyltransferase
LLSPVTVVCLGYILPLKLAMIPCIFFGLFGLLLGSFLNVCILRLPAGESVVWPGSHCRQCNQPIAARDNIPVLSYLLLGAACRACGSRIAWRYPVIELATCALFVMCCLHFSFSWLAGCWALLCFLLLGLAVMDAETLLLPDLFTLPGLVTGVVFAALRPGLEGGGWAWGTASRAAGWSLLAAAVAAAALLLIAGAYWLARRRMGMGLGDVKLLALLAAWLGLRQTGVVLFLAVVAGALYGLGTILLRGRDDTPGFPMKFGGDDTPHAASLDESRTRGGRSGPRTGNPGTSPGQLPVPFGTMLSLAGLYSIFLGERTLGWYMQFFH